MPKTPGIESTQIYTEARNLYSEIKGRGGIKDKHSLKPEIVLGRNIGV